MADALSNVTLIEEGLPGRTTCHDDPVKGEAMNGLLGLKIALNSHGPIDWLVLMLGTNDLKTRFAPSPARVAAGLAALLDIALSPDFQMRHGGFQILLICPPAAQEKGMLAAEFMGAETSAMLLPEVMLTLAKSRNIPFFDAGTVIETSADDGIHFDADAHKTLGIAVADAIRSAS